MLLVFCLRHLRRFFCVSKAVKIENGGRVWLSFVLHHKVNKTVMKLTSFPATFALKNRLKLVGFKTYKVSLSAFENLERDQFFRCVYSFDQFCIEKERREGANMAGV